MRANTVMPLALISVSSRSIVSFGPKLLGMVVNPSAAIAFAPHNQIPTIIATNFPFAKWLDPSLICSDSLERLTRVAAATSSLFLLSLSAQYAKICRLSGQSCRTIETEPAIWENESGAFVSIGSGSFASFRARDQHDRFTPMNGHFQRSTSLLMSSRVVFLFVSRNSTDGMAADKVVDILEAFIAQHHTAIERRGALIAANKALKATRTFLRWCVGRAVLDQSPADGVPLPAKEAPTDRVLADEELARVIIAGRKM